MIRTLRAAGVVSQADNRTENRGAPFPRYLTFCLPGALVLLLCACDRPAAGYFPVAPGYEWNYEIRRSTPPLEGLITQKSIIRSLGPETVGADRYYPRIYANGRKFHYTRSTEGISRKSPGSDSAERVIGYPLRVGTQWSSTARLQLFDLPKKLEDGWDGLSRNMTMDYTITSLDEAVNVPAGRFSRCLRIDAVGFLDLPQRIMLGIRIIKVEQTQWYAPEVGLIKMTRREFAIPNLYPSEYTQVLTSFKQG